MKKILIILVTSLLNLTAYSQIQTDSTVFDIFNSYFAQTFAGSQHCSSYRQCVPAGTYAQTIFGYEWRGVTGNPGAAWLDKNPMKLSGIYYPYQGWHKEQDSFTIKYLFQKGYKYKIVMKCYFDDSDPNYGPHPPALQLQLTNTPDYTYGRDCYVDTTPIPAYDLMTNSSNPALQFNGNNTIVGPQTPEFTFTPGTDYSHVWINSRTTTAYENYGVVDIYKIVIYKTLDVSLFGPDNFCNGNNTVYKINQGTNLYSGSVTWSATGNLSIGGPVIGNTVTVTNNTSSQLEYGDLTATLQNATLTKHIAVGLQTLTVSNVVDRSDQSSHYQYLTATAQQIPGTVPGNYKWYVENSGGTRGALINTGLQILSYPMAPCTRFYYQCEVTQPCGTDLYRGVAYNTYCGSSFASNSMVAYPNPANSELNIDTKNIPDVAATTDNSVTNDSYKASLYNDKGKLLKSGNSIKGKIKINTEDIPNGIYFLHVIGGDDIIKKQKIIINH